MNVAATRVSTESVKKGSGITGASVMKAGEVLSAIYVSIDVCRICVRCVPDTCRIRAA